MTKAIAFLIIAALAVAVVLFVILRSGGESPIGPIAGPDGTVTTASGLQYVDEVVGNGESPKLGQMVTVHYTGTLENGTKFDSSVDQGRPLPFKIGTGEVIRGWDEGIMTMKVGGKRRLIVPPSLGYGAKGFGTKIPPNATLIFEVELLGVQ
ncbi:MAG TPA: FKBP-type peptidyl-prolyl cis-trans isomerase [Blastocatellia bacterium]|nr:FKBP-type peptidyl-prolyl cis-trans isomerase [Blastocatellia bacterium]